MGASLMSTVEWGGRAFTGGWKTLSGGSFEVTEPATGRTIGRVARAAGADVRESAAAARAAQKAWAAVPYADRAGVFRRAASLLQANRAEYAEWIMRETGSIEPKAMFEIDSVLHHCHEAAAVPTQPRGASSCRAQTASRAWRDACRTEWWA